MKLQILYNFALIKPLDDDTGGIVTPDSDKKIKRGKVVKAATQFFQNFGVLESKVKEGDIVYYPSFSEQPVRIDGDSFVMVNLAEIYGVEK